MPASKQQLNKSIGQRLRPKLPAAVLLLLAAAHLPAQQGGFISGLVREPSGVPIAGAQIRIVSELTGARQTVYCNNHGAYISSELGPGAYRITAKNSGFRSVTQPQVLVQSGRTSTVNFGMELLPLQQEITVQSAGDDASPAGNGLEIGRASPANALPANGRDLHTLYALIPGAAMTPASMGDGGQFTVGGQRPNTNSFRVDGISGNTGIGISALPGTFPGSSLPGMTVLGGTRNLAAKDEIARAELRSFDFAPEFGSRPGAQIRIETRSGSNRFHGSAFGYLRPRLLDSSDWFASCYNMPTPPASLTGYGANLGGAVLPNRTFFFLSFERERVQDTAVKLTVVPSIAAREAAPDSYALLLNAFPAPTGLLFNANESLAPLALQKQASVTNYSARIDQNFQDNIHLFARYANVPSRSTTEQWGLVDSGFRWNATTLGATIQSGTSVHDLRLNFTRVIDTSYSSPPTASERAAFAAFQNPPISDLFLKSNVTALSLGGIGQLVSGTNEWTSQNQWEARYVFGKQAGAHSIRAGADYIRLLPRTLTGAFSATTSVASSGVASLLAGDPLGVTVSDHDAIQSGQIPVASVFAQDTFHVSNRLSLLYGLRWEITANGHAASGTVALPNIGAWNGPGTFFQGIGALWGMNLFNWPASYTQFAPRFGVAYRLPGSGLVLRAGAGLFYDSDLGSLIDPVNLSPLNIWQFLPAKDDLSSLPFSYYPPPASILGGADLRSYFSSQPTYPPPPPALSLPRVWEWRTSLEKSIPGGSTVSLSYLGSSGRRLLRDEAILYPQTSILEYTAFTSHGASDYEALQLQFTGHVTPRLYSLISYTWGHSIDTGSQDSSVFLVGPGYNDAVDRGSSSFDIRHNLNASLSYRLPAWRANGFRSAWFGKWNLSTTMQARSGLPFDVTTVDRSIGFGFANSGRPDLVPSVPLWLSGQLNPSAFRPAPNDRNGTLGRNVLTGPGLFQIDASLRRQFRLFRGASLETSLTAFNLFNRTNFANPESYLASPLFGKPVSLQNLMLGSGSPTGGLTPLFQSGGPRTVELNLKFTF